MTGAAFGNFYRYVVARFYGLGSARHCILTVTIDAPAHVELGDDFNFIHVGDVAVALLAIEASCDVRLVREARVVGEVVDFHPAHGDALVVGLAQVLDVFGITGHVLVALHTGGRIRHTGMRRFFNRCMTELTVECEFTSVNLMTERDRLVGCEALVFGWREDQVTNSTKDQNVGGDLTTVFFQNSN